MGNLDQRLFEFYAKNLRDVSSLHELNQVLRERPTPDFLYLIEADLIGEQSLAYDAQAFPDAVTVGGVPVAVSYAYAPGEENDGVTIKLPFTIAQFASAAWLEWAVPGLREEKLNELLRALPKSLRRELMPFPPKVVEIAREFQPSGTSLLQDLARFLTQRYGVKVSATDWPADALPPHLRARVEVVGGNQKAMAAGRDLNALRPQLEQVKAAPANEPHVWSRAAERWEKFGITTWSIGDLPTRITVSEGPGLPVYAWPGLEVADGIVNLRLFRGPEMARESHLIGVRRLVELAVQKDLGWLEKDLRSLREFAVLYAPLGSIEELQETALENLKRFVLPDDAGTISTQAQFQSAVEAAQKKLPGLVQQFTERLRPVLELRQQVQLRAGSLAPAAPPPKKQVFTGFAQLGVVAAPPPRAIHPVAEHLAALFPPRFLERISFERLPHVPRYLKAMLLRMDRSSLNPAKDKERQQQLEPYAQALKTLAATKPRSSEARRAYADFYWMVEEFKVSLFAQELGTAMPVSPKRLDEQWARARDLLA
jgi:ATP-dependent helicase HrpA